MKRLLVSIPQAVSTVATQHQQAVQQQKIHEQVSIPQAVSTVATEHDIKEGEISNAFQYRKR